MLGHRLRHQNSIVSISRVCLDDSRYGQNNIIRKEGLHVQIDVTLLTCTWAVPACYGIREVYG